MTARGDGPYDRTFREAFIRPGLDPARWGNRSNYAALNVVPTGPAEMSIYTTPFRRFVLRTDGFASVHAGRRRRRDGHAAAAIRRQGTGRQLLDQRRRQRAGRDAGRRRPADPRLRAGRLPQPGRRRDRTTVSWTKGSDVSSLAGQPVRLRVVMQEADLFAIQFRH